MTHFIIKALVLLTVLAASTPAAANGPIGGGPWKPTSTVEVSTLL